MSKIQGRAKKFDGTAIDYVSIFNWVDGKCITQIKPDAGGNWSYPYYKDINVGITYIADGCEPITHGVYEFVAETFDPSQIFTDNQGLWFDAADESSITVLGGKSSAWNDKSGGSQHATQSNAALRPQYDAVNKAIVSTGAGEALAGIFNTINPNKMNEYTLFVVVSPTKTTISTSYETNSGAAFFENDVRHNVFFESRADTDNTRLSPVFSATTKYFVATETRAGIAPTNIVKSVTPHSSGKLLLGVTRGSDAKLNTRIFGELKSAASSATLEMGWETFKLPAQYTDNSKFEGSIHEFLLIHNGSLRLDLIEVIEAYLANKWGISDSLIDGHFGKTYTP